MSGPLAVRLFDGVRDAHVTQACSSYSFTKTAPGGHSVAQLRLDVPRADWPDLGDADRVWLYDQRTGATAWEGYTNSPGDSRDAGGEGFDLTAQGGMMLTADDRRASIYLDRDLGAWERFDNANPGVTVAAGDSPPAFVATYDIGLTFQFPAGMPIGANTRGVMIYRRLMLSGQRLYAAVAAVGAGKTDSNDEIQLVTRTDANLGTGENAAVTTFSTTASVLVPVVVTNFPLGRNTVEARIFRTAGATNVADDTTWGAVMRPSVRPILLNPDGTDQTTVAHVSYVLASEVVKDVIGRMLPLVDPVASTVATSTAQIDQLAYPQAVTARTVLDDVALWEPDFLWEVLHTTGSGKHIANYRAWPTTARYEISTADGYSRPGTDSGLCNRLAVNWNDEAGIPQSITATAVVPELIVNGVTRIRHADPINLPDGRGSAAAAAAIGAAVLADINARSNAGSATVRRPIIDLDTGNKVEPWEIQTGYNVRVKESGDLLPLSEMTYSWSRDGGGSASLSLGRPRLTLEQRVARLDRVA